MNKLILFIVFLIAIVGGAWYLVSPAFKVVEINEESPLIAKEGIALQASAQGNFIASAHDVTGKAFLIPQDGNKILRFENFETINGPDLHIYLSKDLGGEDYIDLGKIKATRGNVNYDVPSDIDITKYNKVLVWCAPFKVLFSYAELELVNIL